jgi:hypothetical protein
MPAFNAAAFADLKPGLIAELIAKDGMSPAKAEAAASDYGRFLALVSDEKPTCPPSLADLAWHRHLEMETYAADTVKMCGRVLNHDPSAFGTPDFAEAWADTRARWAAAYGEDLEIDPTKADVAASGPAACWEQPSPEAPARLKPAACWEQPEPARLGPAACWEQPSPEAPARLKPAACWEQPEPARLGPAACWEQPSPEAPARLKPAACWEQPAPNA